MQRLFIFKNFVIYLYVPGCTLVFHNTIQLLIFCKTMPRLFLCKTIQCMFFRAKGCTLLFSKTMHFLVFFQNFGLFFFLLKVDVSHYVEPCKVFVFLKLCNVFLLQKVFSFVKPCFAKLRSGLFLRKRGNLLLCIPVHCLPSTLAQSNTVTVSECSHTPVVKVLEALRQLMDISVYLAESVWLCTFDDRAQKHNHSKSASVSHDIYTL